MQERIISEHVKLFRAENAATSNYAAIAFAGIAQGLGTPVFEFFHSLQALGVDALFIRDPSQGWYSRPIPGLGAKPSEMAATISGLAAGHFPGRKIVTVGNCMGGFAALLFGCLCGFSKALCFSPQTFISPDLRAYYQETRCPEDAAAVADAEFGDVKPLLLSDRNLQVEVYVGAQNATDLAHAGRLAGIRNVTLHTLPECGHMAARWLKEQGRLESILSGMFA